MNMLHYTRRLFSTAKKDKSTRHGEDAQRAFIREKVDSDDALFQRGSIIFTFSDGFELFLHSFATRYGYNRALRNIRALIRGKCM